MALATWHVIAVTCNEILCDEKEEFTGKNYWHAMRDLRASGWFVYRRDRVYCPAHRQRNKEIIDERRRHGRRKNPINESLLPLLKTGTR